MTLLIGVIRDNQCVLSGDYRRTHIHNTTEYYDNIIKIYKANDNILVGYAGDLSVLAKLSRFFDEGIKNNTSLDGAARRVKSWVKKNSEPSEHITVLLVGKADNGKPAIINISHWNEYRLQKRVHQNGQNINWEFVIANTSPDIESKLAKLGGTIEDLENLCRVLNAEVSKTDSWVSEKCEVVSLEI